MARALLLLFLFSAGLFAQTPQLSPPAPDSPTSTIDAPLPSMRELLLDVERNEKLSEAARQDYTYHVHSEEQELDSKGNRKKNTMIDAESLTIDGVRVNRIVARDGKPLTPDETKKENDRIDKEVAKAKERRAKLQNKGKDTDANGDDEISASRILELGSFSNPRRILIQNRSTIVADYTGDPNAKTHNAGEAAFRNLVGTVWIDEQDRVLVRAQGHFINDFKIGAGLIADIKKGSQFEAQFTKVNNEVWLPTTIDGQGKIRILLFAGFNGRIHLATSDYRKFRTTSTIVGTNGVIDDQGHPTTPPTGDTPTPPADPK